MQNKFIFNHNNQIQDTLKKYVKNYESLEDLYAQLGQVGTIAPGRYLINKNDSNYRIVRGLRNNIPVKLTFNNQETLEKLLYRISSQVEPGVADLYQTFTEPAFLEEMKMTKENVLPNRCERCSSCSICVSNCRRFKAPVNASVMASSINLLFR